MRRLTSMVTALLATTLLLTGCNRAIDGAAAMDPRDVDPASFFAL